MVSTAGESELVEIMEEEERIPESRPPPSSPPTDQSRTLVAANKVTSLLKISDKSDKYQA